MKRIGFIMLWLVCSTAWAQTSVVQTVHNLSVSGPGPIRATSEQEVCIFCHTPHNASQIQPLWNRNMPMSAYTIYSSSSLNARPDQPTGKSKLCLSCHDGSIALGSVLSRDQPIMMAGAITTLPPGASNLGTDLSDDHPISFRYDSGLVADDPHLQDPSQLPDAVHLDINHELQCTSCHDAHSNTYGHFLVMDNSTSQLCTACHRPQSTQVVAHQQCIGCHQTHSAPSGPLLLSGASVRESCLTCHDGSVPTTPNIAADMNKWSVHDTDSAVDLPDALPDNVGCTDCHQPHTMGLGTATAPNIHPNFGRIDGAGAAGAAVNPANFEYEVCFKCHANQGTSITPTVNRQITQTDTSLEFDPSAVSFHPVMATGKNSSVPSLKSGWTEGSMICCSDCHGSDSAAGPHGVHGSNQRPLLVARYDTADNTNESAAAYALCYRCHDRNSILGDDSFEEHKKHIEGEDAPCSVCHDPHGIASAQGSTTRNNHLINFDTTVVLPGDNHRLEFVDRGYRAGECSLTCHGEDHDEEDYHW